MAEPRGAGASGANDDLRRRLAAAHAGLLRVHKALIDHERSRYERTHGSLGGPLEVLQLVLNDPWFAWLRPVSELIVQIDEFTDAKQPREPSEGQALLKQAQALVEPDDAGGIFAREYFRAIQESPEVAMAHGHWRRAMGAA